MSALASRVAEGQWRVDRWWRTYNGTNVAAVAGIELPGDSDTENTGADQDSLRSSAAQSTSLFHVHRALLTQPIHVHCHDVDGPFSHAQAADDQIVCSATHVFLKSAHLLLWNRLGALLRSRDDQLKDLGLKITDRLLRAGRASRLWRLGYHLARAKIEESTTTWSPTRRCNAPFRSLPRAVTIVLLRHHLQGAGARVAAELASDLIDLLRVDDAVGQRATSVLRMLIAQPAACQQLLSSDCFVRLSLYAREGCRLASDVSVRV